jgi:transposase-like protein/IS1 family transposase
MQCPTCQNEARRFGHDRKGNQRWQCLACRKTFVEQQAKPLGDMRLSLDQAILCLKLLTEGNSIRSTSRISGVAKDTVIALLVSVGQKCEAFLRDRLQSIDAHDVQADEIWGFVRMKEKTATKRQILTDEVGDAYCFVAIERHSKLILAWSLGKRNRSTTDEFAAEVVRSTRGHFQLTTDGFKSYPEAVSVAFESAGRAVDHAALVKTYGKFEDDHRYSPSEVLSVTGYPCCGNPDMDRACTSHIERQNLTIRMRTRRMTRLTNAFSKKWDNHRYALALHFAAYNFVTPHGTLTKDAEGVKTTPAMKAGLTDHVWTLEELLVAVAGSTH